MTYRFLILVLAAASAFAVPPTPKSHFGHEMGADRTTLDWDKVVSYFQALAKSSDRLRVDVLGKSTEGRPFLAVTISTPDTLKHLNRYIEIQSKLADPRRTSPSEAERLMNVGKSVVLITCSIHATELAATHTAVEFAYRLVTEDKPRFRAILDNTVFLLVPSLNPDGLDLVTRWYRKTLGTPFEGTSPPELYQKYLGHDNNRDWYIFSQVETQHTISKLHNVWHPHIVYDVHQQGAYGSRLFIPPWLDPWEPNIDPLLMQQTNMIGTAMATDLTAEGKTGIAIHAIYDFWSPARHYQAFHGGMRILTESASARLASPLNVSPDQIDKNGLGYKPREPSWNHLEPWLGGTWRLRDIVDYQLIAWESCLYNAAIHRADLLRNFYRIGQRQVARNKPWGFVIPAQQEDPGATRKLLETLAFGMVEVGLGPRREAVIPMRQPYSGWAKALLERQQYPEDRLYPGGPPKRPYDVTAHTLPLLMGVAVETVDRPVAVSGVWKPPAPAAGPVYAASDSDAWKAINRVWANGGSVWRQTSSGNFSIVPQGAGWKQISRPRVGLYKSWMPNMDEGWTRWALEQFGFAYTSLRNADVQSGNLRRRFDVIVFPDASSSSMANGYRAGSMPPEYTGGLGEKGAAALKQFLESGGTLVFFNRASEYAIQNFKLPVKTVGARSKDGEFYSPGSLLNARLDTRSPLAYGLPAEITIWCEHSPAFETDLPVVVRYPDQKLLASGWLLGEKVIAGRAALVDAPAGPGRVILFGMKPQYRGQAWLTFKLLFNSLLYH